MKAILITGGSRGIGRSAAILAGARGWSVAINYVGNEAAAEATADAVRSAGGRAITVRGDVSAEADVLAMFDAAEREFGALDGVVVNAGVLGPARKLVEIDAARLRRIFEINILGGYFCAREAARRLARAHNQRSGSIVLVSSIAARLGAPFEYVDYAGSKGAMDTLAIGLSKEAGPDGIRVNAVRPGLIETGIHASGGAPDRATRLGATTPIGRSGQPDEVGEAIVWLLSDAASYVSGAILDIGGGR